MPYSIRAIVSEIGQYECYQMLGRSSGPENVRRVRRLFLSVFGLGVLLLLAGCGEPADSLGAVATTQGESIATTTSVGASAMSSTDSTFPIEVVQFAEASGLSPAEAAEILEGQRAQGEGYERLVGLVGEGLIVEAAFDEDYARADELTVFVVDEEAVAVVEDRLIEAGLDSAKTKVEVAPEAQPDDPWDWLRIEPYVEHEWLDSPGPHILGAWRLVESNGVSPPVPVLAGFGTRWGVEACSTWLGDVLTSADGRVTISVDYESLDCDDATETVEELIVDVIAENEGEFEVGSVGDTMTWTGSAGGGFVWQMDESIDRGPHVYPPNRPEALDAWAGSPAPEMEGVWHLLEVGAEDPAAPVSLHVGVSTIRFEGLCNDLEGLFALSADNQIGLNLHQTLVDCSDSTGDVEAQLNEILGENGHLLGVSVEGDVMTWANQAEPQVIWSR